MVYCKPAQSKFGWLILCPKKPTHQPPQTKLIQISFRDVDLTHSNNVTNYILN